MDKVIELKSRRVKNYLKQLTHPDGSESRTYKLVLGNSIVQGGFNEAGKFYIDPIGSRSIVVGEMLEEAGAIVKNIDRVDGFGYCITFEEDEVSN